MKIYKHIFIQRLNLAVKILLIAFCISSKAIEHKTVHLINKGEVIEISLKNMMKFNISNKDAVSHKNSNQTLIIRGKKEGYTQVSIWRQNSLSKHDIYVLSQNKDYKLIKSLKQVLGKDIRLEYEDDELILRAFINNTDNYDAIVRFLKRYKNQLRVNVELSSEFKKIVLQNIYYHFLNNYIDTAKCEFQNIQITCDYKYSKKPNKKIEKELQKNHLININAYKAFSPQNYKVIAKVILVEDSKNESVDLGINSIEENLRNLLNNSYENILNKETISLNGSLYNIYQFAEQKSTIRLNHPLEVKIGTERAFNRINMNQQTETIWRFVGLKLKININKKSESFIVQYESSLSLPSGSESNKTNSEKSSFYSRIGEYHKVFETNINSKSKTSSQLPFLGDTPYLRKLFSSDSDSISNLKYVTYLKLEEL